MKPITDSNKRGYTAKTFEQITKDYINLFTNFGNSVAIEETLYKLQSKLINNISKQYGFKYICGKKYRNYKKLSNPLGLF